MLISLLKKDYLPTQILALKYLTMMSYSQKGRALLWDNQNELKSILGRILNVVERRNNVTAKEMCSEIKKFYNELTTIKRIMKINSISNQFDKK